MARSSSLTPVRNSIVCIPYNHNQKTIMQIQDLLNNYLQRHERKKWCTRLTSHLIQRHRFKCILIIVLKRVLSSTCFDAKERERGRVAERDPESVWERQKKRERERDRKEEEIIEIQGLKDAENWVEEIHKGHDKYLTENERTGLEADAWSPILMREMDYIY